MVLFLTFSLALLPGLAVFWGWRGPRVKASGEAGRPNFSLPAAAVLRDGAVGATRWAYAALLVKLARDGHCTLVRTRKQRWLRKRPTITVDLHADPTVLTSFEQTALRQLSRHDTLDGFGFAGSTFRRRTLRDVRRRLVERGWLADRRRRSTGALLLGLGLLGGAGGGLLTGASAMAIAVGTGMGTGSLLAAVPRFPVTTTGARRRAAHRAYARAQHEQIHDLLPGPPRRAARRLIEALPALVLERRATPRRLCALADRFEAADADVPVPDWVRDEGGGADTFADACRTLAHVLRALGAKVPWGAPFR